MKAFFDYQSYAFVLAHPDDEMYTTTVIKRLTDAGKRVDLIYLTSGDYRGKEVSLEREVQVVGSATLLGVDDENLHLLRFSEVDLKHTYQSAPQMVSDLLSELRPDCVVSHDYEGGNNCHDFSNLCAGLAAQDLNADFWTFPAYHNQPDTRVWAAFIDSKQSDLHLVLNEKEREFKQRIWNQHTTEKAFFERVLASTSKDRFAGEEMLRLVKELPDYQAKPTDPVGYDFPGSPVRYADFHEGARRVLAERS